MNDQSSNKKEESFFWNRVVVVAIIFVTLLLSLQLFNLFSPPSNRDKDFELRLLNSLNGLDLKSVNVQTDNASISIDYETTLSLPFNKDSVEEEFISILSVVKKTVGGDNRYNKLKIKAAYYGHLTETPYYEKEFNLGN